MGWYTAGGWWMHLVALSGAVSLTLALLYVGRDTRRGLVAALASAAVVLAIGIVAWAVGRHELEEVVAYANPADAKAILEMGGREAAIPAQFAAALAVGAAAIAVAGWAFRRR